MTMTPADYAEVLERAAKECADVPEKLRALGITESIGTKTERRRDIAHLRALAKALREAHIEYVVVSLDQGEGPTGRIILTLPQP